MTPPQNMGETVVLKRLDQPLARMFAFWDLRLHSAASAVHLIWFYRDAFQGKYHLVFISNYSEDQYILLMPKNAMFIICCYDIRLGEGKCPVNHNLSLLFLRRASFHYQKQIRNASTHLSFKMEHLLRWEWMKTIIGRFVFLIVAIKSQLKVRENSNVVPLGCLYFLHWLERQFSNSNFGFLIHFPP